MLATTRLLLLVASYYYRFLDSLLVCFLSRFDSIISKFYLGFRCSRRRVSSRPMAPTSSSLMPLLLPILRFQDCELFYNFPCKKCAQCTSLNVSLRQIVLLVNIFLIYLLLCNRQILQLMSYVTRTVLLKYPRISRLRVLK